MALQLGALRDALDAAGVENDLARKAAEEVAGFEQRFPGVGLRFDALERRMEQRFAAIDLRFADLERRLDQRSAVVETRFAVIAGKVDKLFWAITTIGALTLLTLGKVWFP
jgi:hypothetical protein